MNAVSRPKRRLPIKPAVLRWAREWSCQSVENAAKRASVSPERIREWEDENGDKTPTVNQARRLADLYSRSFLELIRDEPPELSDPHLIPDFRMYRGAESPIDTHELKEIQRWAETQRVNALDLFSELNEHPPTFPESLFSTAAADVEAVSSYAREALNFPIATQTALRSSERWQLPGILRRKIEDAGVLTLKQSGLRELRVRGYCIALFPLPVIVFGNEAPSAQSFTLAHEFAHILLRQSAISGPMSRTGGNVAARKTEEWCNAFAAAFLLPRDELLKLRSLPKVPADRISDADLHTIANYFAVSEHATLIRLVKLGFVRSDFYWNVKKAEFDKKEHEYKGGGRPKYYGTRYRNALGDMYTSLVIEAWSTGRITNHNAAEYMGIKNLAHLKDIRENF